MLSVVVPNRNDSVMLSVTVRSCLEELKAVPGGGEVVVVDNSDEDIWKILSSVNISPLSLGEVEEGKVQLIHQPFPCLYSARETAIRYAKGKYIYNMDSHTLVGHDSLKHLVDFMENAGPKVGMGFAPIGWISQHELYARHDIRSDEGTIYGNWGRQYDQPTKILWNFGSRICNRDWFLNVHGGYGFYAKKRLSWGGGELYAALKTWLLGFENWAIPCAPQYHIGPFSSAIERRTTHRYRVYDKSGNGRTGIGVLAAFYALAGEQGLVEARKTKGGIHQYGIDVEKDWPEARKLALEEWEWINTHQVISLNELLEKKPWMENWGEDRWSSWKPYEKIQRNQDLSKLIVLPS